MKKILCFSMVFMLAALLVVPCFAAETIAAPSDPVDWFGSSESVLTGYTVTISDYTVDGSSKLLIKAWLLSVGATSAANGLPDCTGVASYPAESRTGVLYAQSNFDNLYGNDGSQFTFASITSFTYTSSDLTGYDEAAALSSISGVSFSDVYSSVGVNGFVDSGVSDALTELSLIVSAILSNQYILIAIGLAVAVPLVAWGISKIKSLVKGY